MRHLPVWRLSVAVLFCLTSAFAQNVTLTMTSAGNNPFAGVMTSPYTLHDSTNGFDISAFCTTFSRDVYPNQPWQAQVTTLDNYSSSTPDYYAMAFLAFQIHNTADLPTKALLSFALWGVSEWSAVSAHLISYGINDGSAQYEFIEGKIADAMLPASRQSVNPANVTIYTPTSCIPNGCTSNTPQYFISVRTPEPSALTLLGFDLMALIAVIGLVFRGRKSMPFGLLVSSQRGDLK